ncbi:MAG: DUF1800 domain-containing protein [Sedimentisphaerales bacterium]|nr:DUF1800 domain-containing protein [Sedimentisphaerales bacterium]
MAERIDTLRRDDLSRAWAPYEPDARRPWNLALAAHLYRRAGFGTRWEQLQQALADGPRRTVDRLLRPDADIDAFNRGFDENENATGSIEGLQAWWLRRMIETPHPLLEKMTLFWHSHLATSAEAVNSPSLMRAHIQFLRCGALGSFASLLEGISRDPAMLVGLGAGANRKAAPNEGFARPLLQTFTLGAGAFDETDVREAARALTGWFVLRERLRYIPREHDDTAKQVLGRQGNFTADDIRRMVLEHPATSRTLVRKLYRWLISESDEPSDASIAPLADSFARDYDIARLVETMLRSNLFFSPQAYRRRVKSPVEYAVGIVTASEAIVSTTQLAKDVAGLGQSLYYPPTVRGWSGGQHWISTATMVRRHNLAAALLADDGPYGGKLNPWALAQRHGSSSPDSAARFLADLLVQSDPPEWGLPESRRDSSSLVRALARLVMTLPEFQLA